MSNKTNMINKFNMLSQTKPMGIDLTNINPVKLFSEIQDTDIFKNKLNRFGQIFGSLEGLKQFNITIYNKNVKETLSFRDAILYNELVQIQVFFEFIKDIKIPNEEFPNLKCIIENKNNIRLNKIRNSISHFDWEFIDKSIIFKDNNFEEKITYYEVSEFCSLISCIAIFMTNNIDNID